MFVRYLVDAVDLFGRVDHKPTSGAGLHGERLSSPPPKKSENDNVKGRQAGGSQFSRGIAVTPRQSYWGVSLGGKLSSGTAKL